MKEINNYVPVGQYNEDEGRPLESWKFIPNDADPSVFYDVPKDTIFVKKGDNPFDIIEEMVSSDEMRKTWIIIEKSILGLASEIPGIYHFPATISNPEVFNFNSHNFSKSKIIHLNSIEGFGNWRIICAWMGKNDEFIIPVPENPEKIVKVIMI